MAAPSELEIKLLIPAAAIEAVAAHPLLQGAAAPKVQRQVTTYFDTPGWDLAHMGASLRIRRRGRARVQTLKLRDAAGQAFERGEWEWPVTADAPDRALLAETPLAALLAAMPPFAPVFATTIARRLHVLEREGSVIEVALDAGEVRAGAAAEPILELELELKSGPAAPLFALAEALQAGLPLTLGAESKAERGWRLSTGRPRAVTKPGPVALPPGASAAEAFRRIIGAGLTGLLANLPAAAEVEGVHQLRVGIRRLRAALALFRPLLDPVPADRFGLELRRLGQVLGAARDWDVFCAETLAVVPAAAALRPAAEAARAAARRALAEELAGPALSAVVLGLAAWAEAAPIPAGRLAAAMPRLERRLARKARRRGRRIRQRPPADLHALRKAVKKLRYGVEALAPLHRRRQARAFLAGCAALQAELGLMNDAAMAEAMAGRLDAAAPAEAVAALRDWAAARQAKALERIPRAWHRFKALPLPEAARDSPGRDASG